MAPTLRVRRLFGEVSVLLEHAALVVIGFVLMVVGLGLGVTMIMLPVGIVLGLTGIGLIVVGLFEHFGNH